MESKLDSIFFVQKFLKKFYQKILKRSPKQSLKITLKNFRGIPYVAPPASRTVPCPPPPNGKIRTGIEKGYKNPGLFDQNVLFYFVTQNNVFYNILSSHVLPPFFLAIRNSNFRL